MSPWEQKAEQLGVEYMPWNPPNHGRADRAHFNYQGFVEDAAAVEAEAALLRDQVGIKPIVTEAPQSSTDALAADCSERQCKLDKASEFLANMDSILRPAG